MTLSLSFPIIIYSWHPEFEVVTAYKSYHFELFLYFSLFKCPLFLCHVLMKYSRNILYIVLFLCFQTSISVVVYFALFWFHFQDDHVTQNIIKQII